MTTATRVLEFDAGHRVLGHQGKCRHLHGHRYKVEITVTSPELDHLGMVIDFGEIKSKVGHWIDSNLDHVMILHPDDPMIEHILIKPTLDESGLFLMPADIPNPTAENIAELIFNQAISLLPDMQVESVTVHETPNCRATIINDLQ